MSRCNAHSLPKTSSCCATPAVTRDTMGQGRAPRLTLRLCLLPVSAGLRPFRRYTPAFDSINHRARYIAVSAGYSIWYLLGTTVIAYGLCRGVLLQWSLSSEPALSYRNDNPGGRLSCALSDTWAGTQDAAAIRGIRQGGPQKLTGSGNSHR